MFSVIGCVDNEECPSQNSCIDHKCQDPCIVGNPCASQEECQVHHHQPTCVKGIILNIILSNSNSVSIFV